MTRPLTSLRQRLIALATTAVVLACALLAYAPARSKPAPRDAVNLVYIDAGVTSLPTRVDQRGFEKPVLSPGTYWVELPEPAPRIPDPVRATSRQARPDQRTLSGWCLAHSTSTALS